MPEIGRKSHIGNIFSILDSYYRSRQREYSYLSGRYDDLAAWKSEAREKVLQLLNYFPEESSLNEKTIAVVPRQGYVREEIEFNTSADIRVRGTLLIPDGGGRHPALIALHDHSGVYYYGREKIIEQENEPNYLKDFKASSYSGRSWADEAAKRGYVILCIDGFYFGHRKLDLSRVDAVLLAQYENELAAAEPGSDSYIRLYNKICGDFEVLVVKHILTAGTTWPGMLFYDDRKSVDYLCTRKEVDTGRIGCCGLSLGGIRSAYLAALDERIKCSVVAGWMPTFESLLFNNLRYHTYMVYVPGLSACMELPDVVSMTAPNPLFVQQCARDGLYNIRGMEQACDIIADVYHRMGARDRFTSSFYDNKHEFNLKMQEDAFAWLDKWIGPSSYHANH